MSINILGRLYIDMCEYIKEVIGVARLQLALNVRELDSAIAFYAKLFNVGPAKVRPGYANFAIADPPLKLVLIEDPIQPSGSLSHLGVEVEATDELKGAQARLSEAGLETRIEEHVSCCYAVQDKVWVTGPDGSPWEIYAVLADAEGSVGGVRSVESTEMACCASRPDLAQVAVGRCDSR